MLPIGVLVAGIWPARDFANDAEGASNSGSGRMVRKGSNPVPCSWPGERQVSPLNPTSEIAARIDRTGWIAAIRTRFLSQLSACFGNGGTEVRFMQRWRVELVIPGSTASTNPAAHALTNFIVVIVP